MNKKKNLTFFLIFILLVNCSFSGNTGIWDGSENEKRRISKLESEQKKNKDIDIIYSSDKIYSKEIPLTKNISVTNSKENLSWKMSGLNLQNFVGNIYLSGIDNNFLKKKLAKITFQYRRLWHQHWFLMVILFLQMILVQILVLIKEEK